MKYWNFFFLILNSCTTFLCDCIAGDSILLTIGFLYKLLPFHPWKSAQMTDVVSVLSSNSSVFFLLKGNCVEKNHLRKVVLADLPHPSLLWRKETQPFSAFPFPSQRSQCRVGQFGPVDGLPPYTGQPLMGPQIKMQVLSSCSSS